MRQLIPRQPPHPHFIQNHFFLVLTFTFSLNVIIWPFIFGNSPGADNVDQKVWRKRLKPDVMDSLSNTKRYTSFINLKMKTTIKMTICCQRMMMTHLQLNTIERLSKTKRWDPSIILFYFSSRQKEGNHRNSHEICFSQTYEYPAVNNIKAKWLPIGKCCTVV